MPKACEFIWKWPWNFVRGLRKFPACPVSPIGLVAKNTAFSSTSVLARFLRSDRAAAHLFRELNLKIGGTVQQDAAAEPPYSPQMAKTPVLPPHPERICWGCDRYCAADALGCGNGTIRTPHPCELFGDDWLEWATRKKSSAIASTHPTQA